MASIIKFNEHLCWSCQTNRIDFQKNITKKKNENIYFSAQNALLE